MPGLGSPVWLSFEGKAKQHLIYESQFRYPGPTYRTLCGIFLFRDTVENAKDRSQCKTCINKNKKETSSET